MSVLCRLLEQFRGRNCWLGSGTALLSVAFASSGEQSRAGTSSVVCCCCTCIQRHRRRIYIGTPYMCLLHPQRFRFRAQHHHHRPHVVAPWRVSWRNFAKRAKCQVSLAVHTQRSSNRAIRQDIFGYNSVDTSHRMAKLPVGRLLGHILLAVQDRHLTSTPIPNNESATLLLNP